LQARFIAQGVLPERSDLRDVRQVINDINPRLRYAIGEYADPPTPAPG
jgi:hypothetical protein